MMRFLCRRTSTPKYSDKPHADALPEGAVWAIEVRDLAHLMDLAAQEAADGNGLIIQSPGVGYNDSGLPLLEFYDDYRE